jgi:hypothetical protein
MRSDLETTTPTPIEAMIITISTQQCQLFMLWTINEKKVSEGRLLKLIEVKKLRYAFFLRITMQLT